MFRSIQIQYMSDLHLELGTQYQFYTIPPKAPYLVLAGDIGRLHEYEAYLSFLARQCASFTSVFLVLGNHEFFGTSREEGLRYSERLEQEPILEGKLMVLNRRRVNLGKHVTLLGCTMHSQIRSEKIDLIQQKVKDFRRISNWTVTQHNLEHARDVEWLRREIAAVRTEERQAGDKARRRIVVATHHAPSRLGTSKPHEANGHFADAFATDLLVEGSELTEADWWISGHTHHTARLTRCGVELVSNQRGYVLPNPNRLDSAPNVQSKSLPKLLGWTRPFKNQDDNLFDATRVITVYGIW